MWGINGLLVVVWAFNRPLRYLGRWWAAGPPFVFTWPVNGFWAVDGLTSVVVWAVNWLHCLYVGC
jgi:hypothetical protein